MCVVPDIVLSLFPIYTIYSLNSAKTWLNVVELIHLLEAGSFMRK